jgi:hypothetical protein
LEFSPGPRVLLMRKTVLMFLSDWETQIVFAALSIGQFAAKRNLALQTVTYMGLKLGSSKIHVHCTALHIDKGGYSNSAMLKIWTFSLHKGAFWPYSC